MCNLCHCENIKTTYYVSSIRGKDRGCGLSPEDAFATLSSVNALSLHPGDRVLLECGSVFTGESLHLSAQGAPGNPIVIGKYGEGPLPCIHGCGTGIWYQDYGVTLDAPTHVRAGYVSSTVLLTDVSYLILSDLEITNCGGPQPDGGNPHSSGCPEAYNSAHKMDRTGVALVAKNRGTLRDITLRNLLVHDVEGNVYNKHMNNGGIYATALRPDGEETGAARFVGLTIENCFVYRVCRWGIAAGYTYLHEKFQDACLEEAWFRQYGHEDMVIRNNYVKAAGGDGITPMYALRPLVEHNTVHSVAWHMNAEIYCEPLDRASMVAAAIWPWKCKDALFRFNEAADTRLNQDGMAYDADSGDGTLYEYNYSRLNEGGCFMICLEQAVHSLFCHNVSEDDLGGTISPANNPEACLSHNTFYKRDNVPFLRTGMSGGKLVLTDNRILPVKR